MRDAECLARIVMELRRIAPEIEPDSLDTHRALREQVDLDSMDWLQFLVALSKGFRIEIPESVYERLRTLDDLVKYLARSDAGSAAADGSTQAT
jgi:acyl carrier protein